MKTRKLGNSGLDVSAMGLGCMGMNAVAVALTPDDLNEIDTAASQIKVHGRRGTSHEQYL